MGGRLNRHPGKDGVSPLRRDGGFPRLEVRIVSVLGVRQQELASRLTAATDPPGPLECRRRDLDPLLPPATGGALTREG